MSDFTDKKEDEGGQAEAQMTPQASKSPLGLPKGFDIMATTKATMAAMSAQSVKAFLPVFTQFVEAMSTLFPDDSGLQAKKLKLRLSLESDNSEKVAQTLCSTFHKEMSPYYQHIEKRDPSFIKSSKLLMDMGMDDKWEALNKEERGIVFDYLDSMATHANGYGSTSEIDEETLKQAQDIAQTVAGSLLQGKGGGKNVDMGNLMSTITKMMK